MAIFTKKKDKSADLPDLGQPASAQPQPGEHAASADSLLPDPELAAGPSTQVKSALKAGYPLQNAFPIFPGSISGNFSSLSAPPEGEVRPLAPPLFYGDMALSSLAGDQKTTPFPDLGSVKQKSAAEPYSERETDNRRDQPDALAPDSPMPPPGFTSVDNFAPPPEYLAKAEPPPGSKPIAAADEPTPEPERAAMSDRAATSEFTATASSPPDPISAASSTAVSGQAPDGAPIPGPAPMPQARTPATNSPPKQGGDGPGGQSPSMFKAMEAARNQLLPEDLPYANEVEAALARKPKKSARLLSLAVCLFFAVMLIWASQARVDEVTHAEGQVISSQRTQSIQNLEGGILREILVSEGQIVEAGDILARLDNETAESSYRDSLNKAIDNYTAIIRLEAELDRNVPQFPADLTPWLQELTGQTITRDVSAQAAQAVQDQMATYTARTQQRSSEIQVLQSVYQQRLLEVDEMLARRKQLEDNLAIATEQRNMAQPLVERGSYSRLDFLGLQQNVLNLENEIETLATGIPRAQEAAREAEQRITFRQAELDSAITDEITRRRQELASVRESLAAGGDRVTRTELRSPVRGTVNQIAITTVGGVVRPGESIMEIVPLDDTLLIEARVKPSDVAFLLPGQTAMVKISAFDFSIFGGLAGTLEQISADTFEDRQGNFHYLARVRTTETAIEYRGATHPIIPGMMATVDIMIGSKTVLDYILKPILKAQQNAFRER